MAGMKITYQTTTDGITAAMLHGFFVGWPNPPSAETHLAILHGSGHIVLAVEDAPRRVVGFITCVTDSISSAFIPHLEVLPELHGRGIGSELVSRLRHLLKDIYAIDLLCDEDVVPFYERLGFRRVPGMAIRNYHNQSGLID